MKVEDFVNNTFLRLTSKTVPYGYETRIFKENSDLFPDDMQLDVHGNYFYKIGESRTIFASHLDTVSSKYEDVNHVIDGDIIRTDGKTTLGADDKAGVTVMLWMIKNKIPGMYYFFIGEEVGCIGSGLASKDLHFINRYDRIISFDRRGTGSVITFQSFARSCSDEFADDLCYQLSQTGLDYSKDDGGVYTDSAEFMDIIPECTNISVGYYKEHTMTEHQDISHLISLAEVCVLVDWESLPTKRDPSLYEPKSYTSYKPYKSELSYGNKRSYGYYDDWYDEDNIEDIDASTYFDEEEGGRHGFIYGEYPKKGKTRRSGKKKRSKKYFTTGSGLIDITDYQKDNIEDGDKYGWITDKFLDSELTIEDLEVIKEQYLDMNTDYDNFFYNYLLESVI